MKLQMKCDMLFSKYIRHKHSDKQGRVKCYTCGTKAPIEMMTLGHWQKRRHLGTRYNEINCQPQCIPCQGRSESGDGDMNFEARLRLQYGDKEIDRIIQLARSVVHMSEIDYEELYDELQRDFKKLKQNATDSRSFPEND